MFALGFFKLNCGEKIYNASGWGFSLFKTIWSSENHLIDRWLHLTFFIHFFRWKWQEHCYYRMRENLAEDEILIVTDYSMNFSHAPFNQVNLYLFFIALV